MIFVSAPVLHANKKTAATAGEPEYRDFNGMSSALHRTTYSTIVRKRTDLKLGCSATKANPDCETFFAEVPAPSGSF
jgi:hypothetical protein